MLYIYMHLGYSFTLYMLLYKITVPARCFFCGNQSNLYNAVFCTVMEQCRLFWRVDIAVRYIALEREVSLFIILFGAGKCLDIGSWRLVLYDLYLKFFFRRSAPSIIFHWAGNRLDSWVMTVDPWYPMFYLERRKRNFFWEVGPVYTII